MRSVFITFMLLIVVVFSANAQESNALDAFNLDHRASFGVGIHDFKFDYNLSASIKDRIILGVGVGFYSDNVKFYSASDEHIVSIGSIPLYVVVQGNVYKNSQGNDFYLKGGFGLSNNIPMGNNEIDLTEKHKMFFGGAGYQFTFRKWERKGFLEVTQYVSSAKGSTTSSYDSKINYNLDVYAVHLTFGVKLNKY